jgi:L-lactate dehydrogenase (cytochrome)
VLSRVSRLTHYSVWFRPRILRNVATVDFSTTILGYKTSMPVYITATALGGSSLHFLGNHSRRTIHPLSPRSTLATYDTNRAHSSGKLGHPEGEVCLTRAAGKHDIVQMVRCLRLLPLTPDPYSRLLRVRRDGRRSHTRSGAVPTAVCPFCSFAYA